MRPKSLGAHEFCFDYVKALELEHRVDSGGGVKAPTHTYRRMHLINCDSGAEYLDREFKTKYSYTMAYYNKQPDFRGSLWIVANKGRG